MSDALAVGTLVVGGGLAGTVAALRARELGRSVLLVEKGVESPGAGNSPMSGGVLHASMQPMTDPSDVVAQRILDESDGLARPELAQRYAATCVRALDWLRARGVELVPFEGGREEPFWIVMPRRGFADAHDWQGSGMRVHLAALQDALVRDGGEVRRETKALRLLEDGDGAVRGAIVRGPQGTYDVEARQVVLADGGFQANPALVAAHVGRFADQVVLRGARAATGDALRMGLALGAKAVGLQYFYGHLLHRQALTDDRLWPAPTLDALLEPGILVDSRGRRFLDEGRGGIAATNDLARSDEPRGGWIVCSEAAWEAVGRRSTLGLPTPPPNPTLVERGARIVRGADVETLAEAASMSTFVLSDTLAEMNEAAEAGGGSGLPIPRTGPLGPIESPLVAIPVVPGLTFTMGGLLVDADARVLDLDERPIRGLFAAGGTMGGLHGGPRGGYVGGLSSALVFGLLAAEGAEA